MTREEALDRAQTRVWVYMCAGDIDYYFNEYNLKVLGKNGRPKKSPSRMEKENALIEYYTDKWTDETTKKVDAAQAMWEQRFRHVVDVLTGKEV